MTRGAQRDRAREKSEKDNQPKEKREGTGKAGVNIDADALQKKVAEKQRLIAEGLLIPKPKSEKKERAMVNPHTGKHDAEWTKKMEKKQ